MNKDKLTTYFQNYPEIHYKKGDKILRPNEYSENIYFIQSGYVRIYKVLKTGQEVTFTWYNPVIQKNVVFGISNLLSYLHIEAFTPTILRRARLSDFTNFLNENPEVKEILTQDIIYFFAEALKQVEWLSIPDAYTRLKVFLYIFGERTNVLKGDLLEKGEPLDLKMTHNIISTFVGLSRETVTIQINRLIREGYLRKEANTLIIQDLAGLKNALP